ncbi:MAG: CHRD domain-containing protein [Fimbriimonadales bacterium]
MGLSSSLIFRPLAMAAVLAVGTVSNRVALTDNLDWDVVDTVAEYKATFLHDGIFFSHTHLIDHVEDGVFWKIWGPWICDTGFLSDDTQVWSIANQHRIPPHGEGHGGIVTWAYVEVPGEPPDKDITYLGLPAEQEVMGHGSHFDIFNSYGIYKLSHFAGIDKIEGFALILVGTHTDDPNDCIKISIESLYDWLNGSGSPSYSISYGCLEPSTGILDVTIAIQDQPIGDFLHASLNLGAEGQNGPAILDLGGPNEWTSRLNGTAISRNFTGQFPQQYIGALLSGQVYLHITTNQYPTGSIRGQTKLVPFGVRATSVAANRGRILSGGVEQTHSSDNDRLTAQKSVAPFGSLGDPLQLEFTGSSWFKTPQTMSVRVETNCATPGVSQKLYLFNLQTSGYELIDQRQVSQQDAAAVISIPQPVQRFIAGDGTVRAKLAFTGPGKTFTVNVDQFRWVLHR